MLPGGEGDGEAGNGALQSFCLGSFEQECGWCEARTLSGEVQMRRLAPVGYSASHLGGHETSLEPAEHHVCNVSMPDHSLPAFSAKGKNRKAVRMYIRASSVLRILF